MPNMKQLFWTVAISLATTIALNYISAKVPSVAKVTANG